MSETAAKDKPKPKGPDRQGMFSKDKLFGIPRLDQTVTTGEQFVLLGAGQRSDAIEVDNPDGGKNYVHPSWLMIQLYQSADKHDIGDPMLVQTLATAIYANVGEALPEEFPAIVHTDKVANKKNGFADAYVLNFDDVYDGPGIAKPENLPNVPDTTNGAMYDGRIWDDGKQVV